MASPQCILYGFVSVKLYVKYLITENVQVCEMSPLSMVYSRCVKADRQNITVEFFLISLVCGHVFDLKSNFLFIKILKTNPILVRENLTASIVIYWLIHFTFLLAVDQLMININIL